MDAKKAFDFIEDNKSMETKGDEYLIHIRIDYLNIVIQLIGVCDSLTVKEQRLLKTGTQERLFRLICANYFLGGNVCKFYKDNKLDDNLNQDDIINNEWKQVTLASLRENCSDPDQNIHCFGMNFTINDNIMVYCIYKVYEILSLGYTFIFHHAAMKVGKVKKKYKTPSIQIIA